MIPDKTYRIEPVTVFRLIDENGDVVLEQDEYGEHHLHYGSYTEALEDVQARRWLPFHGPMPEEKAKLYALLRAQTPTFSSHELGRQDEGFEPGERGNA